MKYTDFLNNPAIQAAAAAFEATFGGHFVCEEPGDRLMYETEDGETALTPPDGSTPEKVLQALEKSVQREKPRNFLLTLWPELEYDPDIDY